MNEFKRPVKISSLRILETMDILLDGELRETQTADYFSSLCPIDCTVPSLNA